MYERQLAEAGGAGAGLQEEMEEVLTPDEREKVATIKRNITKWVNYNIIQPLALIIPGQLSMTVAFCMPQCTTTMSCFLYVCNVFRLEQAEIQLDETIEVISNYITLQSTVAAVTTNKKS